MIRKTAIILLTFIFITLASCSNQTKLPPVQETVQPSNEAAASSTPGEEKTEQNTHSAGETEAGGSGEAVQETVKTSVADLLSLAQAFRSAIEKGEAAVSHEEGFTRYLDAQGSPVYTFIAQDDGSARLIFHKDGTVIRKESVYILSGDKLVAEDGTQYGEDSPVFADYDSLALEVRTQEHVHRISASASGLDATGEETEVSLRQETVYTDSMARSVLSLTFSPSFGDISSAGLSFDTESQGAFSNVRVSAGSLSFSDEEAVRLASLFSIR